MVTDHTAGTLKAFEADIAELFNAGKIRAPIHLSGGNEEQLLEIFGEIQQHDWVGTTWRSHYHCLLKGVLPELLREDIIAGKSITLNYPEHRIVSSAIVGGVIPIMLGIAVGIKRRNGNSRVWVFVGDMTARSGIYHECVEYAVGHNLPMTFVIEDNGLSVCTPTSAIWGCDSFEPQEFGNERCYNYRLDPWPHSGGGVRVNF